MSDLLALAEEIGRLRARLDRLEAQEHRHDHGGMDGRGDDDHGQYALLAGRAGGQALTGGTAAGDDLNLASTSHATKGAVLMDDDLGVGASAPAARLHVAANHNTKPVAIMQQLNQFGQSILQFDRYNNVRSAALMFTTAMGTTADWFTGVLYNGGQPATAYGIALTNSIAAAMLTILANGNVGIGAASPTISDGVGVDINGKILRLRSSKTPGTAGATGNVGEMCWDGSYLYICVATNTWRRVAHASW